MSGTFLSGNSVVRISLALGSTRPNVVNLGLLSPVGKKTHKNVRGEKGFDQTIEASNVARLQRRGITQDHTGEGGESSTSRGWIKGVFTV